MTDDHEDQRSKGGIARAQKLSPKERRDIATNAARVRWNVATPQAVCGSPDRPLRIGDIPLPCYVLEDGRRVLAQRGMIIALGMKRGSAMKGRGDRLANFASGKNVSPYISEELRAAIEKPILFQVGGSRAYGYEATILPDLCDAILKARRADTLQPQQQHLALQCEILLAGLSRVGIIALVDEATGYQEFRERDALSRILEAFVAKEIQAYLPTFPPEFYREMFRLRGLDYPRESVKRPQYFGVLTNDIVYKRLAPGVLNELQRVTPRSEAGRPKQKYFQRLTTNLGYPKLKEHLGAVVATMQLSKSWDDFMWNLNRFRPRFDQPKMLPFVEDYDQSTDDGLGL